MQMANTLRSAVTLESRARNTLESLLARTRDTLNPGGVVAMNRVSSSEVRAESIPCAGFSTIVHLENRYSR